MNSNDDNDRIVDPTQWDNVAPLLGGYDLRPYNVLAEDHYCARPGFYANAEVFAFQPGWDGVDGGDAVYFHFADRPTVGEVRERIASLLVSSWLVQDRDDARLFYLSDDGSIEAPWGIIPADILFAPRGSGCDDAPWLTIII